MLDRLPDEIFALIIEYLFVNRDLVNFMLVCRKFNALCQDAAIWRLRYLRDFNVNVNAPAYKNAYIMKFKTYHQLFPWADSFTANINMTYLDYCEQIKIWFLYAYDNRYYHICYLKSSPSQEQIDRDTLFIKRNYNTVIRLDELDDYALFNLAWQIGYLTKIERIYIQKLRLSKLLLHDNDDESRRLVRYIEYHMWCKDWTILNRIKNKDEPEKNYFAMTDDISHEDMIERFKNIGRYIEIF